VYSLVAPFNEFSIIYICVNSLTMIIYISMDLYLKISWNFYFLRAIQGIYREYIGVSNILM
jgi:hypothetical protein